MNVTINIIIIVIISEEKYIFTFYDKSVGTFHCVCISHDVFNIVVS